MNNFKTHPPSMQGFNLFHVSQQTRISSKYSKHPFTSPVRLAHITRLCYISCEVTRNITVKYY